MAESAPTTITPQASRPPRLGGRPQQITRRPLITPVSPKKSLALIAVFLVAALGLFRLRSLSPKEAETSSLATQTVPQHEPDGSRVELASLPSSDAHSGGRGHDSTELADASATPDIMRIVVVDPRGNMVPSEVFRYNDGTPLSIGFSKIDGLNVPSSELPIPFRLMASAIDGRAAGEIEILSVPASHLITIEASSSQAISGHTLRGFDSKPIPGMRVVVLRGGVQPKELTSESGRNHFGVTCFETVSGPDGAFELYVPAVSEGYSLHAGGAGYATNVGTAQIGVRSGDRELKLIVDNIYLGQIDLGLEAHQLPSMAAAWEAGYAISGWPRAARPLALHVHPAFITTGLASELLELTSRGVRYSAATQTDPNEDVELTLDCRLPFISGGRQSFQLPRYYSGGVPIIAVQGFAARSDVASLDLVFLAPPGMGNVPAEQRVAELSITAEGKKNKHWLTAGELSGGLRLPGIPLGEVEFKIALPHGRQIFPEANGTGRGLPITIRGGGSQLSVNLSHLCVIEVVDGRRRVGDRTPVNVELSAALTGLEVPMDPVALTRMRELGVESGAISIKESIAQVQLIGSSTWVALVPKGVNLWYSRSGEMSAQLGPVLIGSDCGAVLVIP